MSSGANKKSGDSKGYQAGSMKRFREVGSIPAVTHGQCTAATARTRTRQATRACGPIRPVVPSRRFPPPTMQVRLEPQGKQLTISGRRRVGELVQSLGILAGTVMVIRGEDLLTDDEFVDDTDTIELRAVISGGAS